MEDPKDKDRFKDLMKALAIDSGADITKATLRLYFEVLKSYTIEQVEQSAIDVLKAWIYPRMPPLAVIIRNIEGEVQPIEDKALVMANQIVSHLQQWGASKYPDLTGDPIAQELMARRWNYKRWAANVLESELKWWVREFCDAYRAYSGSDNVQIEAPEDVLKMAGGMFERIEE